MPERNIRRTRKRMKYLEIGTAIATDASRVGKTLHNNYLLTSWVLFAPEPL